MPLLDGLDEVAAPHQAACLEAINAYRQTHGLLPTVVCSRLADYIARHHLLQLRTAVVVQPLSPQQVETYLTDTGEQGVALRQALQKDTDLQTLARTPLMLNVLTVVYRETPPEEIAVTSPLASKQEQIFATYVQRMLTRHRTRTHYTREQISHWLAWLAWQMRQQSQAVFYLEQLQPEWLSDPRRLQTYNRLAVRLPGTFMGMLVFFIIRLFFSGLADINFLVIGLFLSGFLGWLWSGEVVTPQSTAHGDTGRSVPRWGHRLLRHLRTSVLISLGAGLAGGLLTALSFGLFSGPLTALFNGLLPTGPLAVLIGGLEVASFTAPCSFLILVFLEKSNAVEASPEKPPQVRRTARWGLIKRAEVRTGLLVGLIVWLCGGVSFALSFGLLEWLAFGTLIDLVTWITAESIYGLILGMLFGMVFGLSSGFLRVLLSGKSTAIQPTDRLIWSWSSLRRSLFSKQHVGMTLQLMALVGFTSGLGGTLNAWLFMGRIVGLNVVLGFGLVGALSFGLAGALSYWLVFGLFQGVSSKTIEDQYRDAPNQGIRRSFFNGLVFGLISAVIVLLTNLLSGTLNAALLTMAYHQTPFYHLLLGIKLNRSLIVFLVISGLLQPLLLTGLLAGLLNGGLACFQHYVLRFLLWREGSIPRKLPQFLDEAAACILLHRVGGGYISLHRLLLDYFASLATPFPEEAPAVAAVSEPLPDLSSAPQTDTALREENASPSAPSRKTGFNKGNSIATLCILALLLLALASGASLIGVAQHSMQKKANDAIATAQTTYQAYNAAATATAQVQANATAEAHANASPVAYPPKNMSPVLDDPLQDNSKGNNWEVDDPSKGNCKFINRAYDINTNELEWCVARTTDFTNFIYEVQMKIVKGVGGGIVFRSDPTNEFDSYFFAINQDGSYIVYYIVYASTDSNYAMLAGGFSSAIHQGLNQTNLVAAVVRGTIIELYVNHQRVAVVGSSTYTHGRIGVIVTGSPSNQTEVIFQNAKVWKL